MSEDLYYLGNLISHAVRTYMTQAEVGAPPLAVYIDEFYLFLNKTWRNALVGCLKRGVNFTMAHHNHSQLKDELLDVVLTNSDLKVCFRANSSDAARMASEFKIKKNDILEMEKYHAYINLFGSSTYLATPKPPKFEPFKPPEKSREIVNFPRDDLIRVYLR